MGLFKRFLLYLLALALTLWGVLSFWFQLNGIALCLAMVVVIAIFIICVGFAKRRPGLSLVTMLIASLGWFIWWAGIQPQLDRHWAVDVAQGVTAVIDGDQVTVKHVRDFQWQSRDKAVEHWKTAEYSLNQLCCLDLATSVWSTPAIAHVLLSFGFEDGRHLVFSAEIRRENDEIFSALGGFFRQYELVLIAAQEHDILKLRSDYRHEKVSLFPLDIPQDAIRELFIRLLDKGNELAQQPEFYNTITSNCTTVVFQLARLIEPDLPLDWRILFSGYLPEYLYDFGVIKSSLPISVIRKIAVVDREISTPDSPDNYSVLIRSEWPHKWQ